MKREALVALHFQTKTFWLLDNIFDTIFCGRLNFQTSFCFVQRLARSACVKVMHITWNGRQIKQFVRQWVLVQVSTCSRLFSWIRFQKFRKRGLLNICRLSKEFHPVVQTIKVSWASRRPLDCQWKQLRVFQGTLGCRQAVKLRIFLDAAQFFSIVFNLCDSLLRLSSQGRLHVQRLCAYY